MPQLHDTARLSRLIGQEVTFEGVPCRIVEILEDGPALILQHSLEHTHIQPDQYGEAHRRVPTTVTVAVLDSSGTDYTPAFSALNITHLL